MKYCTEIDLQQYHNLKWNDIITDNQYFFENENSNDQIDDKVIWLLCSFHSVYFAHVQEKENNVSRHYCYYCHLLIFFRSLSLASFQRHLNKTNGLQNERNFLINSNSKDFFFFLVSYSAKIQLNEACACNSIIYFYSPDGIGKVLNRRLIEFRV